jgi:hypothetical protein
MAARAAAIFFLSTFALRGFFSVRSRFEGKLLILVPHQ